MHPPTRQLFSLWQSAARPVDSDALAYFRHRQWCPFIASDFDLCRVLPARRPVYEWLPATWAPTWRIAVRGYTAQGEDVSLHLRAVRDDVKPKARWISDFHSKNLYFMNREATQIAREYPCDARRIVIVEGISDWIAASCAAARSGDAVFGACGGSFSGLGTIPWPHDVPVIIATHHDAAGEKYAAEVNAALPAHVELKRWRP